MPHTRAARLKAMKESSDLRDMLQLHEAGMNPIWNEYLDWDLPGLTYQPDALAWIPNEGATTHQPTFLADAHSATPNAPSGPLDTTYDGASSTEFCGLQPWYSNVTQERCSVSPSASIRPQLSRSVIISYDSTEPDEGGKQASPTYVIQQSSHKIGRWQTSLDKGTYPRRASDAQAAELMEKPEEPPSPCSEDENDRTNTARSDAHEKRKIAHSVIEKNYRCRIKDGMAELRHCVPSGEKGRRSLDSRGRTVIGDAGSHQSSGKVAILSDAVQYVKALERKNEALHGQLDLMQRRNNTLQKIALSKVDTTVPEDEMDIDDGVEATGGGQGGRASQRSKKVGVLRGKGEGRSRAVAHASSLGRRQ